MKFREYSTKKKIVVVLAVLVIIGAIGSLMEESESNKVTLAQYQQLRNGMTYAEVVAIVGPGVEEASAATPSILGMGGTSIVSYSWTNYDGSGMNLMFQDGRLNTKVQLMLE